MEIALKLNLIRKIAIVSTVVASVVPAVTKAETASRFPDFSLTIALENQPLKLSDIPVINPADQRRDSSKEKTATMPPVTVVGEQVSPYREEDRIGTYNQPRWTADRRFPGVRTYVIPENEVEFEYWFRADVPRKGAAEIQHIFELSFGLPYRFQLDLYGIARTEGNEKTFFDQAIELRYAFADWGKIWGNPALYIEYINRDQSPDKVEGKLLLAGEFAPRWHWGQNFLMEAEVGGQREYEYGWTGGVSYTLIDEKLSIGVEAQFSLFDLHGHRGTYRDETFIGPSIQFRPSPKMHLNIVPLIGVDHESPAAKILVNFAYAF